MKHNQMLKRPQKSKSIKLGLQTPAGAGPGRERKLYRIIACRQVDTRQLDYQSYTDFCKSLEKEQRDLIQCKYVSPFI